MKATQFVIAIQQMAEEIKLNPLLELTAFTILPGIERKKILEKEEEYSVKFDEEIVDLYEALGGLKFKWKLRNGAAIELKNKEMVEGSCWLLEPDTMMMGFDGRHWLNELWNEAMPKEKKEFKSNLKILDYFGSDNVDAVCLEIRDDQITPNLWVNDLDFDAHPLEIDLEKYLDLIIESRGMWGWQFFYTAMQWPDALKNNANILLDALPKLFPQGKIISDLKKRYAERTK